MNPCPCRYYTDPRKACRCNTTKIQNYMGKISRPLLDRIDIHIEIPSLKYKELADAKDGESSYNPAPNTKDQIYLDILDSI